MEARVPLSASARASLVLSTTLAAVLSPATTLAAGSPAAPTRDQCIDANEDAQDLRREGALLDARARLAVCVAASCPGPVRDDCIERLRAVVEATPTLVLDIASGPGGDRRPVTVTLDGRALLASSMSGAIPVDPGAHRLVFESDGQASAPVTVVAREGEKQRHVGATFATPLRSDGLRSDGRDLHHALGLAVGGVGLAGLVLGGMFAAFAKSTDSSALSGECGGDSNACSAAGVRDGHTAHAQALASTIALVGGTLFLGAGAVIYFTAPGGARASVGTAVGAGKAGLTLNGSFR
jgi:hypothetical protein